MKINNKYEGTDLRRKELNLKGAGIPEEKKAGTDKLNVRLFFKIKH
jgi:hypothetical protein